MSEMFLSDVEQTRKILALENDKKELRAESKQLRTEFERTREIVDELVLKFLGHRHSRRDERDAGRWERCLRGHDFRCRETQNSRTPRAVYCAFVRFVCRPTGRI